MPDRDLKPARLQSVDGRACRNIMKSRSMIFHYRREAADADIGRPILNRCVENIAENPAPMASNA